MAALIAFPAVAFAVLVTIMYEDRLLPRPESAQQSPAAAPAPTLTPAPTADAQPASASAPTAATEPAETAPASEPATEPADPARDARLRTRHCEVRQGAAAQGHPRIHRPAAGVVPERRTPVPPCPSRSPELRLEGVVSVPPR